MEASAAKLNFFGMSLDPTDDELHLQYKNVLAFDRVSKKLKYDSPYVAITSYLQDLIDGNLCLASGEIDLPSWLTPAPRVRDLPVITSENNNEFIEGGGCYRYSEIVKRLVTEEIVFGVPAMVAVDHSMTLGMLKALAPKYGSENITALIIDSHFDGLIFSERMELAKYAQHLYSDIMGNFPIDDASHFVKDNPAGGEPLNCANWIRHILQEGVIRPSQIIVFGVSDYPTGEMRQNPNIRNYAGAFINYEKLGVKFVAKRNIEHGRLADMLSNLLKGSADHLYISLDADVGSLNAIYAARFMNVIGISREEMYELAWVLGKSLFKRKLVGIDVNGIETFLLGKKFPNGMTDHTLEILSDFIRLLLGEKAKYFCENDVQCCAS